WVAHGNQTAWLTRHATPIRPSAKLFGAGRIADEIPPLRHVLRTSSGRNTVRLIGRQVGSAPRPLHFPHSQFDTSASRIHDGLATPCPTFYGTARGQLPLALAVAAPRRRPLAGHEPVIHRFFIPDVYSRGKGGVCTCAWCCLL